MTRADSGSGRTVRLFDHCVSLAVDVDTPLPAAAGQRDLVIAPAAHGDESWLGGAHPLYVSQVRTADGRPRAEMFQLGAAHIVRFATGSSFRVSTDTIEVAASGDVPARLVTMQLLGPVMSLWLERRAVLTLHGAAVQREGGRALAVVGPKGSGKSTLAAVMLGRGHALVSEDVLAIDTAHQQPTALPSYPEIRLWPRVARRLGIDISGAEAVHAATSKLRISVRDHVGSFADSPVPLDRLYVLQPGIGAVEVRIEDVTPRTVLVELLRHTFSPRLVAAAGLEQRRLLALARMVESTHVRVVNYRANLPDPAVVAAALEDDVDTGSRPSPEPAERSALGSIGPTPSAS